MQYVIKMTVDLQKRYEEPITMPNVLMVPGENNAHRWEIAVLENGEAVDLSECEVYARFERADGYIREVSGSADGNVASVIFDKPLYTIPGVLRGQFFVAKSTEATALVEAYFNVRMDITGNVALTVDDVVYYPNERRIIYDGDSFFDISDTTAIQSDVRDGKQFYLPDGTLAMGDADFSVTIQGVSVSEQLISGTDYELLIGEEV